MDHCRECDLTYADVARSAIGDRLRSAPERYAQAVDRAVDSGIVRVRPEPGTWSILEYTCHVRDVLAVQRRRLKRALAEDEPTFRPMGRDRRVVEDAYNQQDPEAVLEGLDDAAGALAGALDGLDAVGWRATGIYNWPEPTARSMLWLGRHTVHEVVHHLMDVHRGLEVLGDRDPQTGPPDAEAADIELRLADPDSAGARTAMRAYFGELQERLGPGFDPAGAVREAPTRFSAPEGLFLLAVADGTPVGCGALQHLDDDTAEVKRMWVRRDHRGIGLGGRLLTRLEREAQRRGRERVVLDTNDALSEAVALYESRGYARVEPYNDNPHADHWFAKTLPSTDGDP